MNMLTPKNLKRIEFDSYTCNSDGNPVKGTKRTVVIMFNVTQISAEEVNQLINNEMYEYDDRVVVLRKEQVKYLHDKES